MTGGAIKDETKNFNLPRGCPLIAPARHGQSISGYPANRNASYGWR
ncbi:hypothetical protein L533_3523 [Bordetella bronchiseptica OSU553]|nr:hypothetical protein L533_3523 [Bordetella bronchiseptica OSU553]